MEPTAVRRGTTDRGLTNRPLLTEGVRGPLVGDRPQPSHWSMSDPGSLAEWQLSFARHLEPDRQLSAQLKRLLNDGVW